MPWAVVFPGTDGLPRHPSQIYEALLEGALAFAILFALARMGALKRPGLIAGAFGMVYGSARIFSEFFREPDPRLEDLGQGADHGNGPVGAAHRHRARVARRKPQPEGGAEMTTLLDEIKALIARDGPITVERYMALALAHPEFGYYMNRDPFGASGDFTTAPEISQMFGELLGLWAAEVWASMGSPSPVHLVELGPGRGTLMSDALRAARIVPEFRAALDVWLDGDEPDAGRDAARASARQRRRRRLGAEARRNSRRAGDRHRQRVPRRAAGAAVRPGRGAMAGAHGAPRTTRANLAFDVAATPEPYIQANAPNGKVLEVNPSGHRFMFELGARLVKQGGAALFIDYGHSVTGLGDTLQALRAHRYVDPLAAPGECDLTAHVDFAAMARSASAAGAAVYGPIDQGDFLRAIGIDLRTKALADRADPERAEELKHTRDRLVGKGKGEMGALFKAMAVANRRLPPPPGFQPDAGKRGVSARALPLRRGPEAAGSGARLLHPSRRRLRRRLRFAQRRRRVARRAFGCRGKPRPDGRRARRSRGSAWRCPIRSILRTRSPSPITGRRTPGPAATASSRRRRVSRSA